MSFGELVFDQYVLSMFKIEHGQSHTWIFSSLSIYPEIINAHNENNAETDSHCNQQR
jgi:hypothetical protein